MVNFTRECCCQSGLISLFLLNFQEQIVQPVAMESCPQRANRATVNTQHWVHHLHLLPPPPPHLWTTLSPILQILPNLSSTVVQVTKKPGIFFSLLVPVEGETVGAGSVFFLKSQKSICPALLKNRGTLLIYKVTTVPSRHKPVPVPCSSSGLEAYLMRNIRMVLFQTSACPIKLDATRAQRDSLHRSSPIGPFFGSAASASELPLIWSLPALL